MNVVFCIIVQSCSNLIILYVTSFTVVGTFKTCDLSNPTLCLYACIHVTHLIPLVCVFISRRICIPYPHTNSNMQFYPYMKFFVFANSAWCTQTSVKLTEPRNSRQTVCLYLSGSGPLHNCTTHPHISNQKLSFLKCFTSKIFALTNNKHHWYHYNCLLYGVVLTQKLNNRAEYYCETRTNVLNSEVCFIQNVFYRRVSLYMTQTIHAVESCDILTSAYHVKRCLILT